MWFVLSRKLPFDVGTTKRPPTPPLKVVAGEFLHDRLFFICILCMLIGAIQEGAVFWLPLIFTDVLQLGENSLLLLFLVPLAKLSGVFLARRVLSVLKDNVRTAMLVNLAFAFGITAILLLTARHASLITVVLIALLIAVINASNWYMISYLPLYFSERNIVATLVGAFDFSTYIGAAVMSGTLGVLLLRFGWVALPALWMALVIGSILLAVGGAGSCLALRGQRRP
jgi:sugar phosphate permease